MTIFRPGKPSSKAKLKESSGRALDLRLARALPILVLFALPCLLLWRVVFLGEAFVPADLLRDIAPWRPQTGPAVPWNVLRFDGIAEFYPWREFYAQTVRNGYLPLWNPHSFCGQPFVGNSQSAIFYPLNLIFVLLPVAKAFGVSVIVHLTLTGWLQYLFLRRALECSRPAALTGAIVWQLSTWQVSWLALPTFLCVSAWIPGVLLGVHAVTKRPTLLRATLLSAALAATLLAGHLQIAVYSLLLATAYALFRLWQVRASGTAPAAFSLPAAEAAANKHEVGLNPLPVRASRVFALLAAALVLALIAGSAQLLPSIELSRLSHRAGSGASMDGYKGYVALTAMPAWHLATLFVPDFYGNPTEGTYWGFTNYAENACYVGVGGLILALAGVLGTWRRRRETRFLAVAALFAVLVAVGTPLAALLYFGIPGFASTGSPARILCIWSFCTACLAGIGTNAIVESVGDAKPASIVGRAVLAWALLFAGAAGYAAWWISRNAPPGTLAHNLANESGLWRLPVAVLLILGLAVYQNARGKLSSPGLGAAAAVIVAVDLFVTGAGYNPSSPEADIYPVTPAIAFLLQHRGEGRVMPINRDWSIDRVPHAILPPNAAMAYGLDDVQGYDSLFPGQYMAFADKIDYGTRPTPDANGNMVFTWGYDTQEASDAGARYIVSQDPLPATPSIRGVYSGPDAYIYENPTAVRIVDSDLQASARSSAGPTRIAFDVNVQHGSTYIADVNDQYFPGWKATLDGRPATIVKDPRIFQTIVAPDAPTGVDHVEMRYEPTSVRLGLYGLLVVLMVWKGMGAWTIVASRNRTRSA